MNVSRRLLWVLCLASLTACACDQLSDFRTSPGAVYTGEVVGSDSDETQLSFIRQGFESHTRVDLTFDPVRAAAYTDPGGTLEPAGSLDSYVCKEPSVFCPEDQRVPAQFRGSALEPIPNLTHDALSQYDFPGGGRLRNFILVARFAREAADSRPSGAAMVFVSLMDNGTVEARIIAPSIPAAPDGSGDQPALFGVFVLKRHAS